ncbi:hypothetical protein IFM89_037778 [Coptis chinensis]|uniref:GH18 domain-containing protein n=1 Tax=Coptis chinensis TaxID=261450 RepID=A0A835LJW6_9MAGN|nr:hypothetical protein IFM89_037778 [Coptis chinensis]
MFGFRKSPNTKVVKQNSVEPGFLGSSNSNPFDSDSDSDAKKTFTPTRCTSLELSCRILTKNAFSDEEGSGASMNDSFKRRGNHLEQREKLGLASIPKGRSNPENQASEPTTASEKVEVLRLKGGTHFHYGADMYIALLANMLNFSNNILNNEGWIWTILDVGCGVASSGAYLLSFDIMAMFVAPNDVHQNQIQFALERGIPTYLGVLWTKRLPYPSRSFGLAHCSRCRIDWLQWDDILLLELDRLLRHQKYLATFQYQKKTHCCFAKDPPFKCKGCSKPWRRYSIADGCHVCFEPSSIDSWVENAVNSLTKIIKDYNLDSIDIDYEHFSADPHTFSECIGRLVTILKQKNVIKFASIPPYDKSTVQSHYLALWRKYGHVIDYVNFQFYAYPKGTSVNEFLKYFKIQMSNYKGGKILVSFGNDDSGGLHPENGFFSACHKLKSQGKLHGIFIWSADDSKSSGFPYEM